MKSICVAGIALAGLVPCGVASAAATSAGCPVPAERLLHRLELDLPGDQRVTCSVDIPADTEVLIEAFETNIDSRLEVRAAGAEVATADSPSTVDADGKPRVGEVFAGDLADQRLGAALVVLSGCETALGRAEAGEGLLGLRSAAHASGARTVIASLWPVMDAAGASLMDDIYGEVIGHNASPVTALSRAMRSARKRWEDPALWAAFDVSIAGF